MENLLYSKFLHHASRNPERVAVVNGQYQLTYGDIAQRGGSLATQLISQAKANTLIAIFMHKAWEQVVAVMGILFSGVAYLPIDPELPDEKVKQIISIGQVTIIITQENYKYRLLHLLPSVEIHCINKDDRSGKGDFSFAQNPEDLAYVIFTSGSTGEPKGVSIQHAAAMNTINDINIRFNVTEKDSVLALSELNFDLSVYDIFGMLSVGGKIVIPDFHEKRSPFHWSDLLQKESITLWNSVPAFLQMLVDTYPESLCYSLRLALLSGDWLPLELVRKSRKIASNIKLVSLGGATEASIWSVLYEINELCSNWKSIPYGKAMTNQTIEVLNEKFMQCKPGVTGDIFIGGIGLAKEYWRNEEETAASFFWDSEGNRRLYKTGDLGKYLHDRNIEFLGRSNFQVKINGYRIELGAIEAEIMKMLNIKKSVVVAKFESIYAYIVADNIINLDALLMSIKQRLPQYMIPKKIFQLDELPLTKNGKIDRTYLMMNIEQYITEARKIVPPVTEIEKSLIRIWETLFNFNPISIEDDFFMLGGGSLMATQLIIKMNEELKDNFPFALIFECQTIKKLSEKISQQIEYSASIQMSHGDGNPLFLIHPISGQIFCYTHLAKMLNNHKTVYALELPALLNNSSLTIEGLASVYVSEIKARAKPPYNLAGWSMGGLIAYEIARQLEKNQVAFLGLLDSFPPVNLFSSLPVGKGLSSFNFTILEYFCQEVGKVIKMMIKPDLEKFSKLNPIYAVEKVARYIKSKYSSWLKEHILFFDQFVLAFINILRALLNYKSKDKLMEQIYFFKSEEMPLSLAKQWEQLSASSLKIIDIPTSHLGMLTIPMVPILVEKFLPLLKEEV